MNLFEVKNVNPLDIENAKQVRNAAPRANARGINRNDQVAHVPLRIVSPSWAESTACAASGMSDIKLAVAMLGVSTDAS